MADQKAGPMGVEELNELERLHLDATPEPWEAYVTPGVVAVTKDEHRKAVIAWPGFDSADLGPPITNARLIATMRNALPRLLALARSALTAEATGREKGLREAAGHCDERANMVEYVARCANDNAAYLGPTEKAAILRYTALAAELRALAAQPPPALAQPSATRKEE